MPVLRALRAPQDQDQFASLSKLTKDLRRAAATLQPHEVRYLVDRYYQSQEDRKRAANQLRAASKDGEPNEFMVWTTDQAFLMEDNIRKALDIASGVTPAGAWCRSVFGIGPVLTAGLLAHIDITRAPTPSHIWSFAGLDPTKEWLGREKSEQLYSRVAEPLGKRPKLDVLLPLLAAEARLKPDALERWAKSYSDAETLTRDGLIKALSRCPWNAKFKTLCWKCGDSFVKISTNPKDTMYGKVYRERKELEVLRNEEGKYAETARDTLKQKNIQERATRLCYENGKLPPGRLDLRARRVAVKLFLAHLHHVLYETHYGKPPPLPYILEHDPRHSHYVPVPGWPS